MRLVCTTLYSFAVSNYFGYICSQKVVYVGLFFKPTDEYKEKNTLLYRNKPELHKAFQVLLCVIFLTT